MPQETHWCEGKALILIWKLTTGRLFHEMHYWFLECGTYYFPRGNTSILIWMLTTNRLEGIHWSSEYGAYCFPGGNNLIQIWRLTTMGRLQEMHWILECGAYFSNGKHKRFWFGGSLEVAFRKCIDSGYVVKQIIGFDLKTNVSSLMGTQWTIASHTGAVSAALSDKCCRVAPTASTLSACMRCCIRAHCAARKTAMLRSLSMFFFIIYAVWPSWNEPGLAAHRKHQS